MKRHICGISIILALIAAFAATWPFRGEWAREIASASLNRPLVRASSWHVQFSNLNVAQLAGDSADVLVIEPESLKVPFTVDDLSRLRIKPDGNRRIVLAHLPLTSINQQSLNWQRIWQRAPPDWLAGEDCSRPQTRLVRYWHPGWQNMLYRAADSIIINIVAAGFDGVYLTGLNGYQRYERTRASARGDIINLVIELARSVRQLKPDWLVMAENGAELLSDADYRLAIDAAVEEDVLTGRNATGKRNSDLEITTTLARLRHLQREGKPVFAIEYFLNKQEIARAARELRWHAIIPAFGTRARDGRDPTLPADPEKEVGTPEHTRKVCPAGAFG